MKDRVMADGPACITCAARTPTREGAFCEPEKLGQSNKSVGRNKRYVFGRRHPIGTAMRPLLCPHPESTVSTEGNPYIALRKLLKK